MALEAAGGERTHFFITRAIDSATTSERPHAARSGRTAPLLLGDIGQAGCSSAASTKRSFAKCSKSRSRVTPGRKPLFTKNCICLSPCQTSRAKRLIFAAGACACTLRKCKDRHSAPESRNNCGYCRVYLRRAQPTDAVDLAAESGCYMLSIGFESISRETLKAFTNTRTSRTATTRVTSSIGPRSSRPISSAQATWRRIGVLFITIADPAVSHQRLAEQVLLDGEVGPTKNNYSALVARSVCLSGKRVPTAIRQDV